MLTKDQKGFFIAIAIGAQQLSSCKLKQGAVLVRDRKILSYGFNKSVIKNEKWEVSAIYDTIFDVCNEPLKGTTLFCTYFPNVDDLLLITSVGITSLNFMGKVTNAESVKLLNKITEVGIPLEIVELGA